MTPNFGSFNLPCTDGRTLYAHVSEQLEMLSKHDLMGVFIVVDPNSPETFKLLSTMPRKALGLMLLLAGTRLEDGSAIEKCELIPLGDSN